MINDRYTGYAVSTEAYRVRCEEPGPKEGSRWTPEALEDLSWKLWVSGTRGWEPCPCLQRDEAGI